MIVKLFEYLQDNKIDVYFVGQHQGECKKPYVVLKDDGVNSTNSKVGKGYIDLIFFVPQNQFTQCNFFKQKVKGLVKEFKNVKYAGNETGIVTDDNKKALTFSVLYENYKKL